MLDIDDDVLAAAIETASRQRVTAGKVNFALTRKGRQVGKNPSVGSDGLSPP